MPTNPASQPPTRRCALVAPPMVRRFVHRGRVVQPPFLLPVRPIPLSFTSPTPLSDDFIAALDSPATSTSGRFFPAHESPTRRLASEANPPRGPTNRVADTSARDFNVPSTLVYVERVSSCAEQVYWCTRCFVPRGDDLALRGGFSGCRPD